MALKLKQVKTDVRNASDRSGKNDINMVPWSVELLIFKSSFDADGTKVTYYVRTNTYESALMAAIKLWESWEKPRLIAEGFANPDFEEKAIMERLTDEEYKKEWNFAQRHAHYSTDETSNPLAFTCCDASVRNRPVNIIE